MDPEFETTTDLETQSLLLAAAHHDLPALRDLLRTSSPNVQDAETGFTPLHAAVAACEPDNEPKSTSESSRTVNGDTNGDGVGVNSTEGEERKNELEAAAQTIKLLFQNGAIWNDLDQNGETPGCIALRLGLKELYELFVDAGVRAELLLSRLAEYQLLGDGDDSADEEEDEDIEIIEATEATETDGTSAETSEATADPSLEFTSQDTSTTNPAYLTSPLTFSQTRLIDSSANGVMMAWETTLMERSAELLLPASNLRVLNIGHGMGIIDCIFQSSTPSSHHIVEAHPDVLAQMKENGWYDKSGVVVHEGRWQDVIPELIEKGAMFDAIYFDTFAEEYKALREFFTEYVIGLLDPTGGKDGEGGKFGFFNGMGADRQICYDVYGKIVEMDLFEAGFDIEWEDIAVPDLQEAGEWEGVRRPYWALTKYRLPTCSFIG
ncbi:arginine N-methyltransferase 2 [Lepidopterella palustris CBS 459.81]|uniref:Arginine N-methyltransferase 2 n=1 Tax=Lepidopterella palustris CBS 459.81 TaxID=1314670 RepID=A0A8E2E6E6_9PEZI|nr:arginine N-methyltransferase 2 [Lepidopterella palustris CBS 459.81]